MSYIAEILVTNHKYLYYNYLKNVPNQNKGFPVRVLTNANVHLITATMHPRIPHYCIIRQLQHETTAKATNIRFRFFG